MKKMSINDAASYFGISKEAIHNRIRRGSLESSIENGIKMVFVDASVKAKPATQRARVNTTNDRYYKLLEEQNAKLQERVETLENETRSLRDQKELMLIQEREKIEQIYKDKDEQLKSILATLSSQFMLTQTNEEIIESVEVEVLEPKEPTIIPLKKFIKSLDVSDKKAKKLKMKFEKCAKKDARIVIVDEKIYLDTLKHDYSDIIKL